VARRAGAERCSSDALTGPRAGRAGRPKSCRQRLTNRRTRRDRLRHHRFGVRDVEALASTDDPWTAYVQWLRDIVAADTHALTAHLAGLFTPDERHAARTEQMIRGTIELFERVKQAGALRPGMTFLDVAFLLELLAKTRLGDDNRTAELKQRQLAIIIDGLRTDRAASLPGAPPTWEEQESRWNSA
jgi:hypothetical protein